MDLKKITDEIVSRPSTYFTIIITVWLVYISRPLYFLGLWITHSERLAKHFYITSSGEVIFVLSLVVLFCSLPLLIIIPLERHFGWKFEHRFIQNWFVKLIIIPIILFYIIFLLLPPVLLLIRFIFISFIENF